MSEWTDERLQRLSLRVSLSPEPELSRDIRAALDTISAQFRRAEKAEDEKARLKSTLNLDAADARRRAERVEAEVARLRVDLTHYTPASVERAAALEAEVERLRAEAALGYDLSTYAASIHWNREKNTSEWMDGLRERIELVQGAAKARAIRSGEQS
jgi:hypothetical protein